MKRVLLVYAMLLVAVVALLFNGHAVSAQAPPPLGTVGCIWEGWNNVAPGVISDPQQLANDPWLLGNPNPSLVGSTVSFAAPLNVSGIYTPFVGRIRCSYVAPQTGQYKFMMASNGLGKLYYSTADQNFAGKSPIGQMTNAVAPSPNQWLRYCEQSSNPVTICAGGVDPRVISFTAGQTVYFELIYIDTVSEAGVNLNHASAKIQLPDGTQQGPMLGSTLTVPPRIPPSFILTNNGITPGGPTTTSTISATLQYGFTQPVTYTVLSGMPAGMTASFSIPSCSPTCSSVLTLTAGTSTPQGTYTIVVQGKVQWIIRTTSLVVTVAAPALPAPTITANPTVIRLGEPTTVTENPGPNSTTCTLSAVPANTNWSGSASVTSVTSGNIVPAVSTVFIVTCTNSVGTTPASVAVVVNPVSVTAMWNPVTTDSNGQPTTVLGYHVYWGTTPVNLVRRTTVTATSVVLTGFTANVTYYFAVSAYNAVGESPLTAQVPHTM